MIFRTFDNLSIPVSAEQPAAFRERLAHFPGRFPVFPEERPLVRKKEPFAWAEASAGLKQDGRSFGVEPALVFRWRIYKYASADVYMCIDGCLCRNECVEV